MRSSGLPSTGPHMQRIPITPANNPCWATFVSGRSPDFKTHANIGQAKNAMQYRINFSSVGRAAIYERMGDEWVLRLGFEGGSNQALTSREAKELVRNLKPTMSVQPLKPRKKLAQSVEADILLPETFSTVVHVAD